jgi:nicotinamidase-related amidase
MNSVAVKSNSCRINRAKVGLVVVDIQEKFLPVIHEMPRVIQNSLRLVNGANILRVPIFATEQNRKGLGATVPELASAIPNFAPMEKNTFCCCGTPGFVEALRAKGVQDVMLCGIEAHVCVCQTSLGLLEAGFRPFVVADAISSRTPENHRLAVERMRDAGAVIVSTEMVLFEMLECAGTDEFKQMLKVVK